MTLLVEAFSIVSWCPLNIQNRKYTQAVLCLTSDTVWQHTHTHTHTHYLSASLYRKLMMKLPWEQMQAQLPNSVKLSPKHKCHRGTHTHTHTHTHTAIAWSADRCWKKLETDLKWVNLQWFVCDNNLHWVTFYSSFRWGLISSKSRETTN